MERQADGQTDQKKKERFLAVGKRLRPQKKSPVSGHRSASKSVR